MNNGYDQFFKNARKAATNQGPKKPRLHLDLASEDVEQQIRRRMKMSAKAPKAKKNKKAPIKVIMTSLAGFAFMLWGVQNFSKVENFLRQIEIQFTGEVMAAESPAAEPKKEISSTDKKESEGGSEKITNVADDEANFDHLKKLTLRKKELDAKEEELNRMEGELQAQKEDLEKRLKELEEMRLNISKMLEDRVKADDQKVDTLVQMYSNMKAPQAAKIFETMDENLAVEILGRMKKKNAADIMNLLKPEKAQAFSEMFAGYKRRTPASQ